ncbi:outer membrane protein assembly factor BamA [Thalassotalea ponticola]|uniref:outer membrane protein assembly factor BamA n=1 Tax=Thalassotalea ponticola TaxID=1523392 RepID=UPI0025B2A046|nr:outer membrane protein assembly factor BamA [Thalassotalea ponticola]MDN3652547.1 outer membrane protein assembly factor BamA [Thalassotalea ponticola]
MIIKKLALAVLLGSVGSQAFAANEFVVEDIEVEGLQRVALGAALTHIPVSVGDQLNEFRIAQSIKSLYKSGHFHDIEVLREGNSLIFKVKERETISEIVFDGNDDIKDEQLQESLDGSNIRVGETLDRSVLTGIETGLEDFYHSVGKYNAKVTTQIARLPRNRVILTFEFDEGDAAAIEQINIVGNELFSDAELLNRIELTYDSPWWNFMAQDRYQKQTLQGDMESIESYYLDRGYLRFNIDSTQVSMTPNKEGVYITMNVTEGEQYKISAVEFMGDMVGYDNTIKALAPLREGELYNAAEVTYTEEMISKFLGRFGYAYPKVQTGTEINDEDKTVKLIVNVDPGKRVYVNRINFTGNDVTSEEVLRREMRQMEGSWLSNNLLEQSKIRIQRLPYFESVEFETTPVPGEEDLVDVDFTVKEQPSGSFTAGIGYGSYSGLSLNAGIQQNNFLGTGNRLGFSINTMRFSKSANITYTDPYFTIDGVSLGGNIFFSEFDAGRANLVAYNNTSYGIGANVGYPINEYMRLNFGLGYKNSDISNLQTYEQIKNFNEVFKDPDDPDAKLNFETYDLTASLSRITLNRGTFPTQGTSQVLSGKVTLPEASDVEYFKVKYDAKYYKPLSRDHSWTFLARFEAGYGNGYGDVNGNDQLLPFWENFRAGGATTLRGFENNTVGPRAIYRRPSTQPGLPGQGSEISPPNQDAIAISRQSVGGNAMAIAGIELIVPTPFLDESYTNSVRSSLFVDAGNVWDTEFNLSDYSTLKPEEFNKIADYSDPMRIRTSAGLSIQWLSPMGPMIFNFAKRLRSEDGDDTEFFSFNIGKTF